MMVQRAKGELLQSSKEYGGARWSRVKRGKRKLSNCKNFLCKKGKAAPEWLQGWGGSIQNALLKIAMMQYLGWWGVGLGGVCRKLYLRYPQSDV